MLDRETGDQLESHDAWTRDRWSAPTYLLANDRICLLADNAAERDQEIAASRLAIQGRVVGQVRRYR